MEIRAIRNHFGLAFIMIGSLINLSACSTTSGPFVVADDNEKTEFMPVTGSTNSGAPKPAFEAASAPAPEPSVQDTAPQHNIVLREGHPKQYTVKKGDTLWDISSLFLRDAWFWPEIWSLNPQIKNPHLIYPGDILSLIYIDGRPQIRVNRPAEIIRTVTKPTNNGPKQIKLSPNIRRNSLNASIPTIPADAVRQFLTRPRVISKDIWNAAPYIVGSDDAHLILGADNKIYIRGSLDKERIRYSVFRKGNELIDPLTEELLGYEIIYAGQARIRKYGSPSSGELVSTQREVLIGDRLLPTDKSAIEQLYYPRVPEVEVKDAYIISLFDAISSIAKHQIAVINKGANDGLEVGHLLSTYQKGVLAKDRFLSKKNMKRGDEERLMVQLPDERSGLMMIFKTFDKVSYGLILESTRVIRKLDTVRKPR